MSSALTARGSTRRWRKIRDWILERDDHVCQHPVDGHRCGAPATTAGHIIRREHGGGDGSDNLRAECGDCNFGDRPAYAMTVVSLNTVQTLIVRLLDVAGVPTNAGRARAAGSLKRHPQAPAFCARDVEIACRWRRVRGPLTRA